MRRVLSGIIILCLCFFASMAQLPIKEGINKATSTTFYCKNGNGQYMEVNSQSSLSLNKVAPRDLLRLSDTKLKDESAVTNAFLKVFKNQRLKELLPERYMVINFNINHYGKVKFLQFR